jgi:triosephosphate isomerase
MNGDGPMRRKLIAGNWKMNLRRAEGVALATALADRLAEETPEADVLVCPPATAIGAVADAVAGRGLHVGGQDCHPQDSGAHTGDVAAPMLADLGCGFVVVGHSERRQNHGETDALVAAKAAAAHRAGLVAIVCIGETEAERLAGHALGVCGGQVTASLPEGATAANTVVAYEPVWAIGTGRTPTVADVAEVHAHVRSVLASALGAETADAMRILYGGSVKASNAAELLAVDNVDGALVGGASLKADEFWGIVRAARG